MAALITDKLKSEYIDSYGQFMRQPLRKILLLSTVLFLHTATWCQPKVTQSSIVSFPRHSKVKVEAIEEVGKFPTMVFYDLNARSQILRRAIKDENGYLIPGSDINDLGEPLLRFAIIHTKGFKAPLVMAVAVSPASSDNLFVLSLFSEIDGKLVSLLDKPATAAIQGGFYVGYLNKKFGFGLVTWDFLWESDMEGHEGRHYYKLAVYKLRGNRFVMDRTLKTRRKYNYDQSQFPPRELGIRAKDQRLMIQGLRKYLR